MDWRLPGLFCITLFLAACGHGSDDEPAELTGVFRAGGVAGVRYATSTVSGTTDAQGTFRYRPGETVFFSIGGIKLGSAPGAPEISPFTLAGMGPPTTEIALRSELDRTRRNATPLGRAINIATLLLWLDADHDSRNGIDVAARASTLTGVDLDVGMLVWPFASTLQCRVPGLTSNLMPSRSLVHLYRSLNMSVAAHADTRAETRYSNGRPPMLRTNVYGADGSFTSQGDSNDGDVDPEYLMSWTYDPLGRIRSTSTRYRDTFEGTTYSRGLSYEFDARGNATRAVEEYQNNFFGVLGLRRVARFTTDAYGFRLSEDTETDSFQDGTVDSRSATRYTYDSRHNMLSMATGYDFDLDGLANESFTTTVTYDELNRMLTRVDEFERNGMADGRSLATYEYDGNGAGHVREITLADDQGDGIPDARYVVDNQYNGAGYLLSRVEQSDYDLDGHADSGWQSSYTYDDQQRQLTHASDTDYDGDGAFETSIRATFTYDGIGNLLTSQVEYHSYFYDALSTSTYQYGTSGELLGATYRSVTSGAIELVQESTTTVANVVLADGVLMLAQRFLDGYPGVISNYPSASSAEVVPPLVPFSGGVAAISSEAGAYRPAPLR